MHKPVQKLIGIVCAALMAFGAAANETTNDLIDESGGSGEGMKEDPTCENAKLWGPLLINGVCWECAFPIKIAGIRISPKGDDVVPPSASSRNVCTCDDPLGFPIPGILTQLWEPYRMIEFTHDSGCSPAFNGLRFPFRRSFVGGTTPEGSQEQNSFRHYHYMAFPVMLMLDMFLPKSCNPGGYIDFDMMYMSEMDPTWVSDELAFFTSAETSLVSNIAATVACTMDAVSSTFLKTPLDAYFWCAGSWGQLYPPSGNSTMPSVLQLTSLETAKALLALHRRGLVWRTMGDDASCGGVIDPTVPKSMYKFSMIYPVIDSDSSHVLGQSVMTWGMNHLIPVTGEMPVYIIWRWLDCCSLKSDIFN